MRFRTHRSRIFNVSLISFSICLEKRSTSLLCLRGFLWGLDVVSGEALTFLRRVKSISLEEINLVEVGFSLQEGFTATGLDRWVRYASSSPATRYGRVGGAVKPFICVVCFFRCALNLHAALLDTSLVGSADSGSCEVFQARLGFCRLFPYRFRATFVLIQRLSPRS